MIVCLRRGQLSPSENEATLNCDDRGAPQAALRYCKLEGEGLVNGGALL
ncbi:MAG: hypothetical protein ACKER6_00380 [Candidatus Hodgkinia cicadicola]